MEVQRLRALRGPNLWSRHTAIETVVVCTPDEHDIQLLGGFEDRLRALFPKVGALRPASAQRMPVGLAHVVEQAALALRPKSLPSAPPSCWPRWFRASRAARAIWVILFRRSFMVGLRWGWVAAGLGCGAGLEVILRKSPGR